MRALFHDEDAQLRCFLAELPREAAARQAAPKDRDVVVMWTAGAGHRTDILIRPVIVTLLMPICGTPRSPARRETAI